jgi:hypothetical protein
MYCLVPCSSCDVSSHIPFRLIGSQLSASTLIPPDGPVSLHDSCQLTIKQTLAVAAALTFPNPYCYVCMRSTAWVQHTNKTSQQHDFGLLSPVCWACCTEHEAPLTVTLCCSAIVCTVPIVCWPCRKAGASVKGRKSCNCKNSKCLKL